MSTIDDILGQLPIAQIADRLGVDPQTAQTAVEHALPALIGGLHANAQDPSGAASLTNAVSAHDPSLADNLDVDRVDTVDGDKIVTHVFGENRQQVVGQLTDAAGLGGVGGNNAGLIAKLLPLLAPIVMSILAKQLSGHGSAAGASDGTDAGTASSGGGLTDILGSILGGATGGSSGGLDLGKILGGLGGLLGGGTR
jgi:hypothetical protein